MVGDERGFLVEVSVYGGGFLRWLVILVGVSECGVCDGSIGCLGEGV